MTDKVQEQGVKMRLPWYVTIKPCPFCGWGTINGLEKLFSKKAACQCNGCKAQTRYYDTIEEAAKAWNSRRDVTGKPSKYIRAADIYKASKLIEWVINSGVNRVRVEKLLGAIELIGGNKFIAKENYRQLRQSANNAPNGGNQ